MASVDSYAIVYADMQPMFDDVAVFRQGHDPCGQLHLLRHVLYLRHAVQLPVQRCLQEVLWSVREMMDVYLRKYNRKYDFVKHIL